MADKKSRRHQSSNSNPCRKRTRSWKASGGNSTIMRWAERRRHPGGVLAVCAERKEPGYASRSAVPLQRGAASCMSFTLPTPPIPILRGPSSPLPKITYLILTVLGDRNVWLKRPSRATKTTSCAITDPDIDEGAYFIDVGGLVNNPMRITLRELKDETKFPRQSNIVTIQCSGTRRIEQFHGPPGDGDELINAPVSPSPIWS